MGRSIHFYISLVTDYTVNFDALCHAVSIQYAVLRLCHVVALSLETTEMPLKPLKEYPWINRPSSGVKMSYNSARLYQVRLI